MKIKKNSVLIMPSGGCEEIGMNLTLYHYQDSWIMVDCGIGFPEESEAPGIDVAVPDLDFIKQNKIKVSGLVVTHAHEDHLGGVCYLWQYLRCKIYASVFVANFLRHKIMSLGMEEEGIEIVEVLPTNPVFEVGSFLIEMIGLTHSVVEMQGIYISVGDKKIFHTGDWKFDEDPVIGGVSQTEKLKEIGDKGLDVLLCDSTNVFEEKGGSEGSLKDSLLDVIKPKKGRVVISTFSSNVARIHTIAEIAKLTNRTLVIAGTALHRTIAVAMKSGYLQNLEFEDIKEAANIPKNKLLLLATGCQGEKMATVSRLSNDTYPLLKVSKGDTIILSSKMIPVNFIRISNMINRFIRKDIEIVTEKNAHVHVSGHPSISELKKMYELVRPSIAIPIHGSPMHLQEHCKLAKSFGCKDSLLVGNGNLIELKDSGVEVVDSIKIGYLGVDGYVLRPADSYVMEERRKIKTAGIVFCCFVLNSDMQFVCKPKITCAGILDEREDGELIKDCINGVIRTVKRFATDSGFKEEKRERNLISKVSQRISQIIKGDTNKSPLVKVCIQRA